MANGEFTHCLDGKWRNRAGITLTAGVTPDPPPSADPKFAGHIPFRTLYGMHQQQGPRPTVAEIKGFVGDLGDIQRAFPSDTTISVANADDQVSSADNYVQRVNGVDVARPQVPWIEFKIDGNAWDTVKTGGQDSKLLILRNWAKTRRTAGKGPVWISLHHEPNGDGPSGNTVAQNMKLWGEMQLYALNYLSGWGTGSYVAANDVTDIIVWAPIANGFWWGTKNPHDDLIAAAYTPALITAMNRSGGPLAADFYDPSGNWSVTRDANGKRIESTFVFATNYDSCWRQLQKMCTWARANGVKAIAAGEMGNILNANFVKTIDVAMNNRDIMVAGACWTAWRNSKYDYRLMPDNYPSYNAATEYLVDYGGDLVSAGYITNFKNYLARSRAETTPF